MTTKKKELIDQYINALIVGDNEVLNKIGNIKRKLSEDDKPYFKKNYLPNFDAIEARFSKENREAQQIHDHFIKINSVLS